MFIGERWSLDGLGIIYVYSKGSSIWHMFVDSGIGVVRVEKVPNECGDVPMERACLLTLYAEIFANMTKMNAPAKAAKKVCPRAAADGQKRWQYWRKAVAEETSKFPKSNNT